MKFLVLNRDSVKNFATLDKHILIQIYCHDDYAESTLPLTSRLDILQLQFDDWNEDAKNKIEAYYTKSQKAKEMIFFSDEHAKKIIEFVKKYLNKIELIVVQCDAGISRSAAVAAALSKCLNNDDEYFFKHYLPNSLVYKTILKKWERNG
jgi:predicted protein tyrosine phosphatase